MRLVLARTLLAVLVVGLAAPASPTATATDPASAGPDHRHLSAAWSTLFSAEGSAAAAPGPAHRRRHHPHRAHGGHGKACPSCGQRRELLEQALDSQDDLTALRIEFVKQQILKKLGLKERPRVERLPTTMPKPLALAGLALPPLPRQREDGADDFYGRTDQVIVFPSERGTDGQCPGGETDAPSPSSCFVFKLPGDVQTDDVTRAELWLYRRPPADAPGNATVTVSEVTNYDLDASFRRRNFLAEEPVEDGEGWVKIDLIRSVKYWFEFNELVRMVEASGVAVVADAPFKPFLVINTSPATKVRRPKRNARCVPGMAECCRDNLYVSFKDIGWDDWILQPLGYEAYFCRGSCTTAASLTMTGSHHNAIVRRLMQTGKKVDLVPCCTPTKYSEISLLYKNNNQTYIQKTLPNMVVEACGCN